MITQAKVNHSILLATLVMFLLAGLGRCSAIWPVATAAAQSTGDTLSQSTKTPTPRPPTASTASPAATAPLVWVARLVSNTLGVTEGQGSIFRVSVQDRLDVPIELRTDDKLIVANSGSKPEYGPYAAEFAPVTAGLWTVSVPALGVSLDVPADNYNLAVIEFVQMPAPDATQVVQASPTPTPLGGLDWTGSIVNESPSAGEPFSRLLVQVVGRDGQPVQLSTISQVLNTAFSGQKPDELGPHMVEFAGLTPGRYFIDLPGLNSTLAVDLKPNTVTRAEFRPQAAAPTPVPTETATNTPSAPTATAIIFTPTPIPSSTPTTPATATALPTATPPPLPTVTATPMSLPTPVTRWIGAVEDRAEITGQASTIAVRISGIEGLPIQLKSNSDPRFTERRCLTGQASRGQDVCDFKNLSPGQYVLTPEGLSVSLPVNLFENETMQVAFDLEVLPSGITGWQARLNENTNGIFAYPQTDATVRVKVAGRPGQVVALRSLRLGNTQYCETVFNPVLGGMRCEFSYLGPGVYQVEALNTGASQRVFLDGAGRAEVEFLPTATYATQTLAQSLPVVGHGARPRQQPTATATPTATAPPTPTSPPPVVVVPAAPTATPTSSPTVTPTPTPAFAWQGRVLETTVTGAGAIGVRAAGLKDHPVVVRSGGWQSPPQITGSKPELGEYGTEFGGLAQGEYVIELVDLAELKVTLGSGQYMLVEFRYDFVNTPQ